MHLVNITCTVSCVDLNVGLQRLFLCGGLRNMFPVSLSVYVCTFGRPTLAINGAILNAGRTTTFEAYC